MSQRSLEDLLGERPGARSSCCATRRRARTSTPACRRSTRTGATSRQAWQQTCVLFNQSYHMADLAVEGPDALTLLSQLARQQLRGLRASTRRSTSCRARPDGYVIGDVILFHLAENPFNLVGRAPALNWITYHAETGGYDVEVELDQRTRAPHRRAPQARTGSRCRGRTRCR